MKQPANQTAVCDLTLEPNDAQRLASLRGQCDDNLRLIETRLNVDIRSRDNFFAITGEPKHAEHALSVLKNLYQETTEFSDITPEEVHLHLREFERTISMTSSPNNQETISELDNFSVIRTKKGNIKPRGLNQQRYVRSIQTHDINFGIGPAGTGKTYLAVACAVEALLRDEVERILLVRPAVEAGERLGFLPGDLAQKVDPYLRPLYDALHEMLGFETVAKLQERNIIEIAPLAYMRGRTLNGAYIILDESQNTTREQMKMFLTRIGFGSTAVITGDMSQIDLPKGTNSGLIHAGEVLKSVGDISFTYFESRDVVRHPIVQSIVDAYDVFEKDN
ncbi:MAG TPA: PhoH family protein [Porticoccaceae bacterium]|nr:PhoH family protein [Porticoccaceae bacterium]